MLTEAAPPSLLADGPAPSTEPNLPTSPNAITLITGGDVTLGFHFEEWVDAGLADGGTKESSWAYPFAEVRTVTDAADVFLVNLECPFTDRGEKIPKNFNFRARPELAAALVRGGVDAVSLANNHTMDFGEVGMLDTMATLDAARIPHFGAGRTLAEARRPLILERHGKRIALLGYLFLGTHNIEPHVIFATDSFPGVAGHATDEAAMRAMLLTDIAAAKSVADFVIPFFHWGREGRAIPEGYQVRLARAAVDAGASAVLGSHPHVLQGMEEFGGRPIVYSLGNFVFGGNWNPLEKRAALLKLTLDSSRAPVAEVVPVRVDRYPDRPFQPYLLTGAEAQDVLKLLAKYSSVLSAQLPQLRAHYAPQPIYSAPPTMPRPSPGRERSSFPADSFKTDGGTDGGR